MRTLSQSEQNVTDITQDYRNLIKRLIDQGKYDHVPKMKEAAKKHMAAWDQWAATSKKLVSFSWWEIIILFPYYLYLNGRHGKEYSILTESQEELNNISRQEAIDRKLQEDEFYTAMNPTETLQ